VKGVEFRASGFPLFSELIPRIDLPQKSSEAKKMPSRVAWMAGFVEISSDAIDSGHGPYYVMPLEK
jgi:hypothetical protein